MSKWVGVLITVLLVAVLLYLLAKPAQSPAPRSDTAENGKTEPGTKQENGKSLKVALVTIGEVNDGGWSQAAYEGLMQAKEKLDLKTNNVVAGSAKVAYESFASYAEDGHDVIIGHAGEWFSPELLQIAARYPSARFIVGGTDRKEEGNVAGVRFVLEDGCFVLGFLAGKMSKTGVLGCVGPKKIPVIESTFLAFQKGAEYARQDIKVSINWTNDFTDVARAKELALTLIQEKADFVFHNANDCAKGVFEAVQEKKDQGVLAFGANSDQNAMFPEVILASAVLDIPKAYADILQAIQEGSYDGKTRVVGMAEGYVWIAYNEALAARVPPEVRKEADILADRIRVGEFPVERLELK